MTTGNHIKLVTIKEPNSSFSEIYRTIRTNIEYANVDTEIKVINVTSSLANEAKSTTACNLGVMEANKYKKVLLIDMDLRNPSVHKMFKIKNEKGVTDMLIDYVKNGDSISIDDYITKVEHSSIINDLYVLSAGTDVVNPTEILGSKKMKQLVKYIAQHFDRVVIDSSPSGIISDGIVTSTIADGTVYIVESGKTKIDIAQHTIEKLKEFHVNLLGVVMTKAPVKSINYGYGYGDINKDNSNQQNRIKIDVE